MSYSMVTTVDTVLRIRKFLRVDPKCSHHKKKTLYWRMVTDVNDLL